MPNDCRELAVLATRFHTHVHRALELRAGTILELLEAADAFRRPERYEGLLEACEYDARGRLGLEERPYPQREYLQAARAAAQAAQLEPAERAGLAGPQIGERQRRKRLAALEVFKSSCE